MLNNYWLVLRLDVLQNDFFHKYKDTEEFKNISALRFEKRCIINETFKPLDDILH